MFAAPAVCTASARSPSIEMIATLPLVMTGMTGADGVTVDGPAGIRPLQPASVNAAVRTSEAAPRSHERVAPPRSRQYLLARAPRGLMSVAVRAMRITE